MTNPFPKTHLLLDKEGDGTASNVRAPNIGFDSALIGTYLIQPVAGKLLNISDDAIRQYLMSVRQKLEAKNTTHAVVISIRKGFIKA